MNYLDGLNERQKEAVTTTKGPMMVLAGAGAGKTRVLTTRIYHLIREGVPAEKILAVTFTNKAAREMRERVRSLLGSDTGAPFIATFHGLGRELLESYGKVVGVPRFFTIWDRDDSEKAIGRALKALDVGAKEMSPRAVLARISRAKGDGLTAHEFNEREARGNFSARIASQAWLRYEAELRAAKALDFDDLIALPVRMLEAHEEVRRAASARWDYVHIDEYQDTNALQGRLADLLALRTENLFVVGDIDQTIYTWRGASIDNLLEFEERHPATRVVVLEHNYRSSKTIVGSANAVIEKNKNRKEKRSVTDNPAGEPIALHLAATGEHEALWIARRIKKLLAMGTAPDEIAVLFRTNFQSRALEEALLHESIPYRLLGTRFFERKEVKDVLAWVRLALDPGREADRMRAVQSPPRGIGKVTLGKLVAGGRGGLRAGEIEKVERFERVVAELASATKTFAPSAFVRLVAEKSGMREALSHGNEEEQERFENVQELASLAARHDASPGEASIAAFLAEAALASDQDEMDRREERSVTLMTAHAAKGLEFDTVFVSGMEEGLFPHEGAGDEDRDEEEERRLFYVAMTRAKHRLILTLARIRKIYGADYLSEPSSFLADLEAGSVRHEDELDIIEA